MIDREKLDIIIFALSRFDGPYSSTSISIAKELSKTNRVFYINHPYSYKDFITSIGTSEFKRRIPALLQGKKKYRNYSTDSNKNGVTMVTFPLTYPINFISEGKLYDFFQKVNDRVFFKALKNLVKEKEIKNFLFLNAYNPYFGLKFPDHLKPLVKVYYCFDDIAEEAYTGRHGARMQKKFMKAYDITLTTSPELLRINQAFSNNIHCLPNAADISLFNKAFYDKLEKPEEFKNITKKVIGFIGNVEQRTDYDLVKKIAVHHPDKLLYLIGPVSSNEYKTFGLDKVENIVFTGGKSIEQLPAYLQNIDCAIIPFKCNKLTKSIYPLKINEYLAGGKPVVTTNFSDAIRDFKEVIYLADNHSQFIEMINKAINEDNEMLAKKRLEFASENSWSSRLHEFWKIVENTIDNN